jgi:hypothetical protein
MNKRLNITLDFETKLLRLCWRKRVGGKWYHSEYRQMSENYANALASVFNQSEPDYEHWIEEYGDKNA